MAEAIKTFLAGKPYPGRGLVIGLCPDGKHAALAYFLMGRSANSRNRLLYAEGNEIHIAFAEPELVEDPTLIFYTPLHVWRDKTVVGNGEQVDAVFTAVQEGREADGAALMQNALRDWAYEPDAPHYTPRITGLLQLKPDCRYFLHILRREHETNCPHVWAYTPQPGVGHLLHTYDAPDGTPALPSFAGLPREILIPDSLDDFTDAIWDNLDEDNKIALTTRFIDLETGLFTSCVVNRDR